VRRQVTQVVDEAEATAGGRRDFSGLRYKLLLAEADLKGAREILANATEDMLNKQPLGAQPSVLKLLCSGVAQQLTTIALDAVGPHAAHRFLAEGSDGAPESIWAQNYLFTRARTIAGGTSEVQRNVVAQELLGT
jgi:alkylation response protein AidB-like acyl-CoA dehydrogenase